MIAVDTSVVVAAFASWHEAHAAARKALAGEVRLPAHVLVESYSVLTRLPPPHRATAQLAAEFLAARFQEPLLTLPASAYRDLLDLATEAGIAGGTIYDALVGATAAHAGMTLVTRDRRAVPTYEVVGVTYEILD